MILVIDNYDSFTFNIVQLVQALGFGVEVRRNDETTVEEVMASGAEALILSPGPCTPNEAGICVDLVGRAIGEIPLLGVCLGHQAIAAALGARIVRADRLMHGKTSKIFHDEQVEYAGVPNPFIATRYHSLIVDPATMPSELVVTAKTWEDEIMGFRHQDALCVGVQYHPESILSEQGPLIIENFLQLASGARDAA